MGGLARGRERIRGSDRWTENGGGGGNEKKCYNRTYFSFFFFFLDCYRFGLLIVLESLKNKYLRVLGSIGNWIFRRGRGGDC